MIEVRCTECNKLLGKIFGNYEIKCPRCGKLNTNKESVKDECKRNIKNERNRRIKTI